jgi:sec-independent protein translocase protein TatA
MPFRVGWVELVILLVIVMMVFGVGKLPQVGSAVGKAIREFRKSQSQDDVKEDEKPPSNNPNTLVE